MFFYDFLKQKWQGIYNTGFHDLHRNGTDQGLDIGFEQNFKMYFQKRNFKDKNPEFVLYEKLIFCNSKKSNFICKDIEQGKRIEISSFGIYYKNQKNKNIKSRRLVLHQEMPSIRVPHQPVQRKEKLPFQDNRVFAETTLDHHPRRHRSHRISQNQKEIHFLETVNQLFQHGHRQD